MLLSVDAAHHAIPHAKSCPCLRRYARCTAAATPASRTPRTRSRRRSSRSASCTRRTTAPGSCCGCRRRLPQRQQHMTSGELPDDMYPGFLCVILAQKQPCAQRMLRCWTLLMEVQNVHSYVERNCSAGSLLAYARGCSTTNRYMSSALASTRPSAEWCAPATGIPASSLWKLPCVSHQTVMPITTAKRGCT